MIKNFGVRGLKNILAITLISVLSFSASAFCAGDKKIIVTTGDLKQDYDVISPCFNYADVTPAIMSDPFVDPTQKLFQLTVKDARDMGGDAVIGLRIEAQNFSQGHSGKVLMYGTVVKFKSASNAPSSK